MMKIDDIYTFLMELSDGFYGEQGSVFNIHPLGYAKLCEEFSMQFDSPWYSETNGIIPDDKLKILAIDDQGNAVCEIYEDEIGIIPYEYLSLNNRFNEELLEGYALRLGFKAGIAEFNEKMDFEKLKSLLIEEPIELYKPFEQHAYFEKISTVEISKGNLKRMLANNKSD